MFKPARMTRLLVGGHREHEAAVIEALHKEGAVHIEDYQDDSGVTRMGTPLEAGEANSNLLVRVRGLRKALDAEEQKAKALATDDPAGILADAEAAVLPVVEKAGELRSELARVHGESATLSPYIPLDVELSALGGLASVQGFLGTAREDPSQALAGSGVLTETTVAPGGAGFVVATACRRKDAETVEKALSGAGFTPAQVPANAKGTPASLVKELAAQAERLQADLDVTLAEQDKLVAAWGERLAALEALLAGEVAKTQAPLQFGVTANTFHLEGWVPRSKLGKVQDALAAKFGDKLYLEELGDAPAHAGHGHDDHDHHSDPADEPPVHLEHKGPAKPFTFILGLLSRPRYGEIDPTVLLAFFFPLFFGFMVGDLAVGLLIVLFGIYLKKNYLMGIGGPAVGKALIAGGIFAMAFGLILFGEALGIHFVVDDHALEEGELSWEGIIYGTDAILHEGAGFPHDGFIHKHVAGAHGDAMDHGSTSTEHAAAATGGHGAAGGFMPLAAETEEHGGSMFSLAPHGTTHLSVNGWFNLGYYSKVHDIQALLIISIIVALIHLVLGFVLGIRNVLKGHGLMLAIQEKAAWLFLMVGFAVAIFGLNGGGTPATAAGAGIVVASIALLWAGAQKVIGAGFISVLEVFGFVGNILSYTRLAAVGASKAGMALAFAAIGFDVIGGAAGWVVYILGMLIITLLAILTGGLHGLRLQFVEFFGKFYEGGGRAYEPFGRRM